MCKNFLQERLQQLCGMHSFVTDVKYASVCRAHPPTLKCFERW